MTGQTVLNHEVEYFVGAHNTGYLLTLEGRGPSPATIADSFRIT
jgi:hypothetical protein